jgi:hypothetical protein
MKKKLLYSASVVGLSAALLIPLMGFSSNANDKGKVNSGNFALESGGIGVPIGVGPFDPDTYHKPTDGIISGAVGCVPDVHTFNKQNTGIGPDGSIEPEHIVFTAGVTEISDQKRAGKFAVKYTIYVEISSGDQVIKELPFALHATPDPNTEKPFWVSAVYFAGDIQGEGRTALDLQPGDYTYKFKAKDKNGNDLDTWIPENHTFTITDQPVNN